MSSSLRHARSTVTDFLDDRIVRWRTGAREGQRTVLWVLIGLSALLLLGSLIDYSTVPSASFLIPVVLGSLLLRYRPLISLVSFVVACVAATVTVESMESGLTVGRISTLVTMVVVSSVIVYSTSRRRSGLPGTLGEAMLVDLNDRLQAQGVVPPLPSGWRSQSVTASAGGAKFAGDFLVANLSEDETTLEMVLVDVCGKGVTAGTQSLQLAGALGGLIGSLPPLGLFAAANDYLLRQHWDDGFATAAHVIVRLDTGQYSIISAGHPPAMRWRAEAGEWEIDGARGIALGIMQRPEFKTTRGTLAPGEALMFYTDGVVEARGRDLDDGIEWLREIATEVAAGGFTAAPQRILEQVPGGDDDRAVLVIDREA